MVKLGGYHKSLGFFEDPVLSGVPRSKGILFDVMEVVGLTEDHRHPKTTDQILHNPRFQASFGPSEPSKIEVSFQSPSGLGWSGVEWSGVEWSHRHRWMVCGIWWLD